MGDSPMDQDDSSPEFSRDKGDFNLDGFEFTFDPRAAGPSYTPLFGASSAGHHHLLDDSISLTESVTNFPEYFGRSYHAYKEGSYAFPNDSAEQERYHLQHQALAKLTGAKLFFAPFSRTKPPLSILDIATGTGEWPIAIGDIFPNSRILATDLSPIQPADVPPNVSFFVEDSSEPWDYSQKFDYIHARDTGACWEDFETQIAQQAFESLLPGGWFEVKEQEIDAFSDDGTLNRDGPLVRWLRDLRLAAEACQRSLSWAPHIRSILQRVGFVDVQERTLKIPINAWPKDERLQEVGEMWERNMQSGLSGSSFSLFHRVFQRTVEQIEIDLMPVRREISDNSIHSYVLYHIVWGKKPTGQAEPSRR